IHKLLFIGFYQYPVLIKVSEKYFTNVASRSARHRVGYVFFLGREAACSDMKKFVCLPTAEKIG
ncbi:hypothetical protein U1288_03310, partial [Enterococcus cecorum]|nr:hypothetical protein [Enterococcus cecorum]MDZ5562094.1 hypothetical protein [Enterococcus cecorum]